ncbi:MFS transporter [Streptomyces sp. NPDC050264]|uniref:MFS transporter n=1 Tax=Streptomyces sp. NPDC050264 TaxID=3155038 RepID=UPI003421CF86
MRTSARAPSGRGEGARNSLAILAFTAVTNLADGALKITLPLLGAGLTSSPLAVATLSAVLMLPTLLLSLHIGVLVDRYDRRALLWLSNAARVASLGTLLVCALAGPVGLPALYGIGFVLGVADVVAATAVSALVPAVIPKSGWERTNAWVAGTETVAQEFCGPVVGGLLVAAGTSAALGAGAGAYVLASLTLLLLVGGAGRPARSGTATAGVTRQIVEGVTFLWRRPALRLTSVALTVLCACWGAWLALMPLIATHQLGLAPQEYGMLLSALGVGGLAGAAAVTPLNRLFGRRRVMFADLVGTFAMVVLPLLTAEPWLIAAAAFAGGFGGVLWSVNARTIGQYLVPDEMRGRYSATARVLTFGAIPVGAALAGALGELLGPRAALGLFAVPVALLVAPFLRTLTAGELARIFAQPKDAPRSRPAGPAAGDPAGTPAAAPPKPR